MEKLHAKVVKYVKKVLKETRLDIGVTDKEQRHVVDGLLKISHLQISAPLTTTQMAFEKLFLLTRATEV